VSWINNLLGDDNNSGSNSKLCDRDIVLDLLNTSKGDINLLTRAITEAANPQLRTMLTNQLNACINDHFKLADIAAQKNWYNPYTSPGQQIKQDLQEADSLMKAGQQQQNS
jgi:similar to spore coat protein